MLKKKKFAENILYKTNKKNNSWCCWSWLYWTSIVNSNF